MRTPRQHYGDIIFEHMGGGDRMLVIEARDAEWRRLVEEAQAERDRLKAESAARETTIETLGADVKASASEWDRLTLLLDGMYTERDRLRGELAEARRLLMTAPLNVAADSLLAWMCARTIHLAGERHEHDSPPAEQAQPTYDDGEGKPAPQLNAERLISAKPIKAAMHAPSFAQLVERAGSLPTTGLAGSAEQEQPKETRCSNCNGPTRFIGKGLHECLGVCANDPDRAPAEQAQEAECTCGSGAHPRHCETHPWTFADHVEELSREALADDVSELSKLVTQLQDGCTESGARRATETAELAKRVEAIDKRVAEENEEMLDAFLKALGELVTRIDDVRVTAVSAESMCRLHGLDTAPLPPEAAGPGHAFECAHPAAHRPNPCSDLCACRRCAEDRAYHAVPPIPEGCGR